MFGHKFYFGSIRKYVTLFGTLFNDIEIDRLDSQSGIYQTLKVPISYAPKEKVLARLDQDPNLDRKFAISLPRMSFELTNINYAPDRKLLTINRNKKVVSSNPNQLSYQYNPVPYDFMFSLYIVVKNAEDGTRILEQILPFFTPDWTASVNLVPDMDMTLDVPTILIDVTSQDLYEGNFEERRSIVWTISFLMKGYVFGPIKKSNVITLANTNFFDATLYTDINDAVGVAPALERTTITPGLTANGEPTSNSSESVARSEIQANDNYGYIISREIL